MRETVTLFVPEGYASGEEFAKDCGFEISKPLQVPWDAYHNRACIPVEIRAAEIYNSFEYKCTGKKPPWISGGNSDMQDKAQRTLGGPSRITGQDRTISSASSHHKEANTVSKSWTIPDWWPLTKNRQAIVGFRVECWFFPELDQWRLSFGRNDLGERLIKIGPLRFMGGSVGINREFRRAHIKNQD